ncbi:nitrate- and nitrite sensing domain-containing protein [Streptomyces sp. NRRL WC-3742]|uniref:sensor histidine kinase n=1 Tax=Streptomyces sp. NRRL WC-3742 TaxID=1463934 RepID=UPI00068DA277|nr:nitrate- and nitrite sensing domain-containing protein [Streptomyces sp. NRRL WC-3742]
MREDRGHAPGARRGAHAGPPARQPRPGPWLRRLRPRSVRARIIALLMVPVVSVIGLWGFATVTTAQGVWDLLRQRDAQRTVLTPLRDTVVGLQAERAAAGQLLATAQGAPTAAREGDLRTAASGTDRAFAPLFPDPGRPGQGYNRADAQGLGAEAAARLDALAGSLAALPELRARVLARGVGWPEAYTAYGQAVDRALAASTAVTVRLGPGGSGGDADVRAPLDLARSRELLAREDALLRAARLSGTLGDDQWREFSGAAFARRELQQSVAGVQSTHVAQSVSGVQPANGPEAAADDQDRRDLAAYEEKVRTSPDARAALAAVPADRWALVAGNTARALGAAEDRAGRLAAESRNPYALGLFTPAGIAVLLGLLAVAASLVISVQIGRGLVTELIGLRNSALDLAGRKLPATIRRLRAGEEVDVEAEAPRPTDGSTVGGDEIGQVHRALGTVQRAAVTAAVERAEVLSGVSGVFVNLARRSQVLVHRQLTLLDSMERRTEDPSELADLFRLDHLTTRMRRHAEGLIILSGAAPGRAWRRPVPLVDVVRAAVSEVEEYARVEVHPLPRAAVAGHAVADLTHLVAELVENATGFSPPHTRVHVRGERVGNGYALEIEDRGLGMGAGALADANRRIAAAEQSDLFDSDRLGLFVVSRLARRHDVRVSLVPSAYGGTTAVVLLPTELLADGSGQPHQQIEPVEELDIESVTPPRTPMAPAAPAYGPTGTPPAAGGPPPEAGEGAALLSFGGRAGESGPARHVPYRSPCRSPHRPAADGGPGSAVRPRSGPERSELAASEEELPRRVRQASLAPQLRAAPERPDPRRGRFASGTVAGAAAGPEERSPEEARAAMAAFQTGWARGSRPYGETPYGRTSDQPGDRPGERHLPEHRPEGETT